MAKIPITRLILNLSHKGAELRIAKNGLINACLEFPNCEDCDNKEDCCF